jgi:hypothetical protein
MIEWFKHSLYRKTLLPPSVTRQHDNLYLPIRGSHSSLLSVCHTGSSTQRRDIAPVTLSAVKLSAPCQEATCEPLQRHGVAEGEGTKTVSASP